MGLLHEDPHMKTFLTNPMKNTLNTRTKRQGFTLIELLVVIAIIAALASVSYGPILNQLNKGDQNMALQNMKQIGVGLSDFSNDYGAYPDDETAALIQERQPDLNYGPMTGEYSNDYLRQLFTKMDSEKNFYCKLQGEMGRTHEPDEKIANGKGLTKGECGFAYVMKANKTGLPVPDTRTPVLMTPVFEVGATGDDVTFDYDSFRGNAFVLLLDQSVNRKTADETGSKIPGLFPENKRKGTSTGEKFIVLAPEL